MTGYNLLPFYFDMQTLMLSSINGILQCARQPTEHGACPWMCIAMEGGGHHGTRVSLLGILVGSCFWVEGLTLNPFTVYSCLTCFHDPQIE